MPALNGDTHLNLTVSDIDRSSPWYERVFAMSVANDVVIEDPPFRYRTLIEQGNAAAIVLSQPLDQVAPPFSELRCGLHHVGFHVTERADLEAWARHFDEIGVEHTGLVESRTESGAEIRLRDPDGIWLEIYWIDRSKLVDELRKRWRNAKAADDDNWYAARGEYV